MPCPPVAAAAALVVCGFAGGCWRRLGGLVECLQDEGPPPGSHMWTTRVTLAVVVVVKLSECNLAGGEVNGGYQLFR